MKTPPLPAWKCDCGYGSVIERPYCPKCHDTLRRSTTAPHGIVLTWTVVHVSPSGEGRPYGLCMVGLESGINVMARFDPRDRLGVGDRATVEIRDDGLRWAGAAERTGQG